jgi:hypothetical protein
MHVSNARDLFLICSVLISTIAFISTVEITMIAATSPGAQIAINETGQFVGNVSETIAENPISTNITGETQEYFADKAK